jgi:hypothetical protein
MFGGPSDRTGNPDLAEKASNELRHWRSSTSMTAPGGGPPTVISAPSRRPKFCSAVCTSMSAVTGSELSPVTPIARSTPPKPSAARAVSDGVSLVMTTCAPSATSSCAVA